MNYYRVAAESNSKDPSNNTGDVKGHEEYDAGAEDDDDEDEDNDVEEVDGGVVDSCSDSKEDRRVEDGRGGREVAVK